MIGARIVAALLAVPLVLPGCSSSSDSSSIDQRSCEIFRDIAANVDIQTTEETRSRIADLYNGYGQSTTMGIHDGLRHLLEGLTAGDFGAAADGITETDSACRSEGF